MLYLSAINTLRRMPVTRK